MFSKSTPITPTPSALNLCEIVTQELSIIINGKFFQIPLALSLQPKKPLLTQLFLLHIPFAKMRARLESTTGPKIELR